MAAGKKSPRSRKHISVRLPMPLLVQLERIAEKNYLSFNDVVRLCLAGVLPHVEKDGLRLLLPE